MARLSRLNLPGMLHLITQRGHNGGRIVQSDQDRQYWRELLAEQVLRQRLSLHAYVLMNDGFQLLLTPSDRTGLPAAMQALGRSYARYFNNTYNRTGSLWDGRYRATVLQPERYLLPSLVMIDLKPVKAGAVVDPVDYGWSSHRSLVGKVADRILTAHALYWGLGNTPFAREAAYAELVRKGLSSEQERDLQLASSRSWAMGDEAFLEEAQMHTTRRLYPIPAGRPARKPC